VPRVCSVAWAQKRPFLYLLIFPSTHLQVHRAPNGTYEGALAVLSEDLVLFPKLGAPCLELCRVTTSLRGTGNTNGNNAPPASLRVVRTLALPIFHLDYRVHTGYIQMDDYFPRWRDPEVLQQERQRPARAPSPLTFHGALEDMVTFLLRSVVRARAGRKPSSRSATVRCLRSLTLARARAARHHGTTKRMPMPEVEKKRTRAKSRRGVWVCPWVR
jgi:hypothetical protein